MPTTNSRSILFHRLQILSAGLGFASSAYLLVQHTRLKSGIQETASFCSLGGFVDCDVVNTSDFAEIFGYSLAGLGAIYYFVCLLLCLASRPGDATHARAQKYILGITALAALLDTGLLGLQLFSLKTLCLLCFFTYLCTAGLFFSALAYRKEPFGENFRRPLPVFAALALASMIAAVTLVPSFIRIKSQTYSMVENALEQFFKGWPERTVKNIIIKPGDAQAGNPTAPIKVVVFSDFQCPFCRKAAFTLHTWLKRRTSRVHFVFKNFPLDSSCNTGMKRQVHPQACALAKLSVCANTKGKFWDFHDRIFMDVSEEMVESGMDAIRPKLAKELSAEEIDRCLADASVASQVADDIKQGVELGINGTPSVYINGKQVTIPLTLESLDRLIEIEAAPAH